MSSDENRKRFDDALKKICDPSRPRDPERLHSEIDGLVERELEMIGYNLKLINEAERWYA